MTGLIQRLLDRGAVAPAGPAPVLSAARSRSPMALLDQRLQDRAFREAAGMLPAAGPAEPSAPAAPEAPPSMEAHAPARTVAHRRDPFRPLLRTEPPSARPPAQEPGFHDPIATLRRAAAKAEAETPELFPATRPRAEAEPTRPAPPPPAPVRPAPRAEVPPVPEAEPPIVAAPEAPPVAEPPSAPDAIAADLPTDPPPRRRPVAARPPEPEPVVPRDPEAERTPTEAEPAAVVRPAPRLDPVEALAPPRAPEPAPPAPQPNEKVIERIVREVRAEAPKEAPKPQPMTAQSVSKIGPLPVRRSAHTIFGLRRS